MSQRSPLRRLPWQVLVPFCIFVLHSLLFGSWLVDDAGISFAYARNLAHGHGLVPQVGAERVEGFSNPLWTLLVAPVIAADPVDPVIPVKVLSLLLVLGTFLTADAIFRVLLGSSVRGRWACAGALMALAVNTSIVAWSVSGLENPLYGLLAALYCLCCVQYAAGAEPSGRIAVLAGLTAASLALTRPDGVLFLGGFLLLVGIRCARRAGLWWREMRCAGLFVVVAIVPVLGYLCFRHTYFGDWLPNTYYAKEGPGLHGLAGAGGIARECWIQTRDLLVSMFGSWSSIVSVLLVVGTLVIVLRSPRRYRFAGVWACVLCAWAIFCLLPVDWMGEYRFATPVFILCYILLFAMMAEVTVMMRPGSTWLRRWVFAAGLVAVLLQTVMIYAPRTCRFAVSPIGRFQYVAGLAAAFDEYADSLGIRDGSVLCPDVGGLLYYSRLKIYDLGGLCDRRIARLIDRDPEGIRDYVLEEIQPTFIDLHDSWVLRTGFHQDSRFRQAYTPIWESPCGWARKKHLAAGVVYDGQYVRKNAVRSLIELARLRKRCGSGTTPLDTRNVSPVVPFARQRQTLAVRMFPEMTPSYMP